jgi:hypothetical protein
MLEQTEKHKYSMGLYLTHFLPETNNDDRKAFE